MITDDQRVRGLTVAAWNALDDARATACVLAIERLQPRARFLRFEVGRPMRTAVFGCAGIELVFVPGGRVTLGFARGDEPEGTTRAWIESFQGNAGHAALTALGASAPAPPDELASFLAQTLGPRHEVTLLPFLVERTPHQVEVDPGGDDPHRAIEAQVATAGFRLLTPDEWEHAHRLDDGGLFPDRDSWPTGVPTGGEGRPGRDVALGAPNGMGLRFGADPYVAEVTADPVELRAGDGGHLVCGDTGPMAWVTAAPAFRWRLGKTDDRLTCFEGAMVRRALSVFADEAAQSPTYVAPDPTTDADAALELLQGAVAAHPELVIEDDAERAILRRQVPRLDSIAQAHGDNAEVLTWCGMLYRKLGNRAASIAVAQRAVAIDPSWLTVSQLAAAYRAADDVDEAVQLFEEAAALDPTDVSAYMEAGRTLGNAGRFPDAAEMFDRVLEREPGEVEAAAYRAYAWWRVDGEREHVDEMRRLARANPDDGTVAELLARMSPVRARQVTEQPAVKQPAAKKSKPAAKKSKPAAAKKPTAKKSKPKSRPAAKKPAKKPARR